MSATLGGGGISAGGGSRPILSQNTAWVDSINGNDATAQAGRQDLPFATIAAALAAASSGDTVYIRPGTYNVSATILKDGVNIFAYGAVINMTGVALQDGQLSDGGSAITCNVYGGTYTRTESVDSGDGIHARIVGMTNASSNIQIWAEKIMFTSTMPATGNYCVWQEAGNLRVECPYMNANATTSTSVGVAWLNGSGFIRAQQILANGVAVYSQVDNAPTGDFYVEADLIDTATLGGKSGGDFTIWQNGSNASAAIWVRASVIKCSTQANARSVVTTASMANKLYVSAQKLFGLARLDGSGLTYIDTDKWEPTLNGGLSNSMFVTASAGTSFVNCRHYDPVAFTGAAIRTTTGGTADLRIGYGFFTGGASSAIGLRCDGGTLRANSMRVDTSANSGTQPAANNGGVLVLTNCTLVANAGADSISASTAQNVVAMSSWANKAVNLNVTIVPTLGLGVDSGVI